MRPSSELLYSLMFSAFHRAEEHWCSLFVRIHPLFMLLGLLRAPNDSEGEVPGAEDSAEQRFLV